MAPFEDSSHGLDYKPLDYAPVSVDRYTVLLKDGETTATIYPIHSVEELPEGLMAFLCDELNIEIEKGDTFPFFDPVDLEAFQNYWFSHFAAVMVLGDSPTLEGPKQWEKECLGTFAVKPNYPGRSGHICTASFLVNAGIRGKGIGRTMVECYIQWAPRLGYTYSFFGLVFETNVGARRIFEALNFKRIGKIKAAGILKGHDAPVDSVIYGRELISNTDPAVGAYRFDKIKYYLETGRYPAMADRREKSRLRSSSSHYRLESGKLMLKDKEVISDPVRQIQICTEVHLLNHSGINKTTAIVSEKYHWSRIKDTVAAAVNGCTECRDHHSRDATIVKKNGTSKKPIGTVSRRNNKVLHSQPNNPNARNIIKSRINNVDEMVSDQLQRHNESILSSHDLSQLDDNIIAAVEAAQRSQHRTHPSYAAAAASAVGGDTDFRYSSEYQYDDRAAKDRSGHSIPVDPEVGGYDHKYSGGGEEMIANALIQVNEDSTNSNDGSEGHNKRDETNMFFKDN